MEKSELRKRTFVISGGRITIPDNIRKKMEIKEGTVVEIYPISKNKLVVEVLTR